MKKSIYPSILLLLCCTVLYSSRLYPYRKGDKFGFVNENLEFIIPCVFDDVEDGVGYHTIVTRDGKKGIIRMDTGDTLIPIEYDEIDFYFFGVDWPSACYICEMSGKFGLIDSNGILVIPCEYDKIHLLTARSAHVKQKGKWGLMYPRGKLVTSVVYDSYDLSNFSEHLYRFTLGDTNYLIDTLGSIINKSIYDSDWCLYFNWLLYLNDDMIPENRLIVGYEDKWGVTDYQNNIIIPIIYESVEQYPQDLFTASDSGKCGLLDRDGNTLLPVEFDDIDWCDTFLFKIEKDEKWAFFNSDKRTFGEFIYDDIGLLRLFQYYASKNGKYGILDRSGDAITDFVYDGIDHSFDPRCQYYIAAHDGKWGFIDTLGNEILPYQYDDIRFFFRWGAYVQKDGKYGVIDINGIEIVPFDAGYENIVGIENDLYEIKVNGKWGLIKAPDSVIIEPRYDYIKSISFGSHDAKIELIELELEGKRGLADLEGNILQEPVFDDMDEREHAIWVCKDWLEGMLDADGKILYPVKYDQIYLVDDDMAHVVLDDVKFYVLRNGIELYEQ